MKFYAGIDLHANNNVLAVLNDSGQLVYQRRLSNVVEVVARELERFRSALVGVVGESTFNWYWAGGWAAGGRLPPAFGQHGGHPTLSGDQVHQRSERCPLLAQMLRQKILPEGGICPAGPQAWRWGADACSWSDSAPANWCFCRCCWRGSKDTGPVRSTVRDLNIEANRRGLPQSFDVQSGLRIIAALDSEIERVEKVLLAQVAPEPSFEQLQTVWGIGEILALVMGLEIWDIHRFKTPVGSGLLRLLCQQ